RAGGRETVWAVCCPLPSSPPPSPPRPPPPGGGGAGTPGPPGGRPTRHYARLFPEPSFVRPGIRFGQLVELNIDTGNVRSFASVADVPATPQVYRRLRRQAHSAGVGVNGLEMANGRRLQVSERRTDRGGIVGMYTELTPTRWTDVLIWLSLALSRDDVRAIPSVLGPRQKDILQAVHAGLRNRAIAERLGLKEQTVKNHVSRL